jgi:hypothetical protein
MRAPISASATSTFSFRSSDLDFQVLSIDLFIAHRKQYLQEPA